MVDDDRFPLKEGEVPELKSVRFRTLGCYPLTGGIESTATTLDEIIEKYVEMNVAHPFREGNGRSMRIWLDLMLKSEIKKVIDWNSIERDDYLMAMERSPIKDTEIKLLLKNALSDEINNPDVFMKGIDASYYYEGYTLYITKELEENK